MSIWPAGRDTERGDAAIETLAFLHDTAAAFGFNVFESNTDHEFTARHTINGEKVAITVRVDRYGGLDATRTVETGSSRYSDEILTWIEAAGRIDTTEPRRQDFSPSGLRIAWSRKETDPCEKGTPGCSVHHPDSGIETDCETW